MFVLEYRFNTIFIIACFNVKNILPSKIKRYFKLILLGGQIFSPSLVYSPAVLFSEKYTYFHQQKIVN